MVIKNALFHRNSLLVLLLLVLTANFTLYHTTFGISILPENPNGLVIGSIIDIAIISPILFITWKRNWSFKNMAFVIAGGLILVRFFIPIEYLKPFAPITWVGFTIEGFIILFEVFLFLILVKYLPMIIRSTWKSSLPVVFSFPNAVDQYIKSTAIIKVICNEILMFYYAFFSWKKPPVSNKQTFTLYKNSSLIAIQIMVIHSIVIESVVVHWWLHDNFFILSIILLILNIYSVIFFIGDMQALRHNPLYITKKSMFISFGLIKRIKINWSNIAEVIDDPKRLEQIQSKNTIEFIARDLEKTYPHIILKLKKPAEAILLFGKKEYEFVAIRVDEPNKFKKVIQENII